jgi:hypothetical protein
MESTKDRDQASETLAAEDEVIDLTDILENGASETVIEISSKMEDLDSLDLKTLLTQEAEAEVEPEAEPPETADTAQEKKEESLEDLLYSLKEEPGEPAAAPPVEIAFEPHPEPGEPVPLPEMDFPPAAAAVSEATVRQQAQASLGEDRVLEIVREVVRETVEKICREQFPSVASQVVAQEIEALKKRVEEET